MKKMIIAALCIGIAYGAQAQKKKPAATPRQKTTSTRSIGQINQDNYGTVVTYMNDIVHCLNEQREELKSREDYARTWTDYYVYDKSDSKNKVIYSTYLKIDFTRNEAITSCTNVPAPSIMAPADISLYNESYKVIRDNFKKMGLIWNDLATYDRGRLPTKDYAKQKCEEWIALEKEYDEAVEKLKVRHRSLAKELFPFSVAGSPHKASYENVFNDFNAIKDFFDSFGSYDEMIEKRVQLSSALTQLESAVKKRIMEASDEERPGFYSDFYEAAGNFIIRARALVDSENPKPKQEEDLIHAYEYARKALVPAYNKVMN